MNSQSVMIVIDSKIFPLYIVFSASYALLGQLSIRISGDPQKEIIVRLKSKDSTFSAEHVKDLFFDALMDCALDGYKFMAASDIRHYFVKAALSFDADDEVDLWSSQSSSEEEEEKNISYHISENEEGIVELSIEVKGNKESLLPRIFSVAKRLRKYCSFWVKEFKDNQMICELKRKNGCDVEVLKKKLKDEFDKRRLF